MIYYWTLLIATIVIMVNLDDNKKLMWTNATIPFVSSKITSTYNNDEFGDNDNDDDNNNNTEDEMFDGIDDQAIFTYMPRNNVSEKESDGYDSRSSLASGTSLSTSSSSIPIVSTVKLMNGIELSSIPYEPSSSSSSIPTTNTTTTSTNGTESYTTAANGGGASHTIVLDNLNNDEEFVSSNEISQYHHDLMINDDVSINNNNGNFFPTAYTTTTMTPINSNNSSSSSSSSSSNQFTDAVQQQPQIPTVTTQRCNAGHYFSRPMFFYFLLLVAFVFGICDFVMILLIVLGF